MATMAADLTVSPLLSDDEAKRAVARRDARYDGRFVYAVESTGIYCRPSCPSRRPSRSAVRFYSGPDDAERRGYRACRRCKPRDAAADSAANTVARAQAVLEARE